MTVLALPDSRLEHLANGSCDAASLRGWLAHRWAILFSHPEDFAQEQLEMDRWVSVLSRSLGERGVAALALARGAQDPTQGWLGRLAALDPESTAVLALDEPPPVTLLVDLAAAALRARIGRSGPRFAMVIDSSLGCRRELSYRSPTELPSPLELIGWAVALRKRDRVEHDARETPQSSLPIQSDRARGARYALAQAARS